MRLFKKRQQVLSPKQEQVAVHKAKGILRGQRKAADYLNKKTAHLSKGMRLALLTGFCGALGSYFLFLLIRAFQ